MNKAMIAREISGRFAAKRSMARNEIGERRHRKLSLPAYGKERRRRVQGTGNTAEVAANGPALNSRLIVIVEHQVLCEEIAAALSSLVATDTLHAERFSTGKIHGPQSWS
ncbi:hypothetical protein [Blastochloris tepida]|uniref:hypothetical protein n=1 Tax=Blastochloris tepida TaxID=2233851 RepID=UPI000F81E0AA|nr:hypothetical protein [Blastochloris tepida]